MPLSIESIYAKSVSFIILLRVRLCWSALHAIFLPCSLVTHISPRSSCPLSFFFHSFGTLRPTDSSGIPNAGWSQSDGWTLVVNSGTPVCLGCQVRWFRSRIPGSLGPFRGGSRLGRSRFGCRPKGSCQSQGIPGFGPIHAEYSRN
jgi:hypothetical protein